MLVTIPGTLMKVTPDSEPPIMPNATNHHGERLPPRKKVSLSFRPASRDMTSRTAKYVIRVRSKGISN